MGATKKKAGSKKSGAKKSNAKKRSRNSGSIAPSLIVLVCAVVCIVCFFLDWAHVEALGKNLIAFNAFSAGDVLDELKAVPIIADAMPEKITTQIMVWRIASIVSIALMALAAIISLVSGRPAKELAVIGAIVSIAVSAAFMYVLADYSLVGIVRDLAPVLVIVASAVAAVASFMPSGR